MGSDLDSEAVSGAKRNLEWLGSEGQVEVADSTHPPFGSFDCIATEPHMGPLLDGRRQLDTSRVENIARGLDKLYRGSLRAWHSHLPVGGRVVITIPSFVLNNRTISTISIDTIRALGYNLLASVPYRKPGTVVTRNITIMEKSDKLTSRIAD